MDRSLIQFVWRARQIAVALTDRNLIIREAYGQTEILAEEMKSCLGCPLLDVVPELLGNQRELEDILSGRSSGYRLDYVNREVEGRTRYLTIEDLPYRDERGEIVGIAHLVQDITSQGELEQQITQNRNQLILLQEQIKRQNLELIAANAELRRLSELKSDFIALAAHDLRTPLTSINGYLEMLLDGQMGPLTQEEVEALNNIQRSSLRLVSLTDELLNAARLEAGRLDLVLKPVDLASLVQAVTDEYTGQIHSKRQRLDVEMDAHIPPALCDEKWAKVIVSNLVSNAVKFTPESGQITVRLRMAEQTGFLLLSVADTGIGISGQDQELIFSRWFRSKNPSSMKAQGAGLGLYITRSLVELHGGEIWVESQPGKGSVLFVKFQLAT